MSYWWLALGAFIVSLILTAQFRNFALQRKFIDVPNVRSSHSVPTPRGGGVAIVATFLVLLLIPWANGQLSSSLMFALLSAGGLVAIAGFLDDRFNLAPQWRMMFQIVAAIVALIILDGVPTLSIFGFSVSSGIFLDALGIIYIVWMTNLYNFMDGIDGLAAAEAITTCIGAMIFCVMIGDLADVTIVVLILLGAVLGFSYFNFPPARIFMGDVGSGFLGVSFALLAVCAGTKGSEIFFAWLILLGVFIVDSTVTLVRRGLGRQPLFKAHRSHAYQHAARLFNSHRTVTLIVATINLAWLCPLAILTALGRISIAAGLTIAYLPLIVIALAMRAGAIRQGA